jgi:hypothetical protein
MFLRRGASARAVVVATVAACSSSSGSAPPDFVLKPNVRVLDAASLARIKGVSQEGTIAFDGHDATLDALAAGDVIAGGVGAATPSGLLRRITRAERTDSGVTVETKMASLVDAIERGKIHLARPLVPADVKLADLGPGSPTGFYVGVNDLVLYEKGGARIVANGSVSLEPSIDFDLDIDLTGIHSMSFTVGGTQALALDITATAGASFDEREDVATYNFVPIIIMAGDFPLVFIPRVVLEIGASGQITAKTTVSVVEQARANVGLRWDGSFSPIADVTPTLTVGTPTVGAAASVKAFAGARAELFLYGELGPYGTLDGYLRLAADTNAEPCWRLDAGVESRFGVKVDVLGFSLLDKTVPVFDQSKTLASGSCGDPVPTEPTPWANVYQRAGGDHASSVDAMPDGGLVLAGDASSDASVMRLAKDGTIVWQRSYPTGTVAKAVRARGDVVFVGGGAWVAKLDAKNGNVLWSYAYGSDPEVRAIEATADGGCVVAGLTVGPGVQFDYWFAKLDANGAVTWSRRMGDAKWEQVNAVRAIAGGGYVLAGQYAPNQNADAFLARLDDAGNVTLQKRYAGTGTFESFDAVLPTSDGGFALVGRAQRPAGGAGWAVKVDGAGNVAWSKAFGETGSDNLYALAQTATGFLATGSTGITPTSAWAVALDGTGHPIWSRSYAALDATKSVEGRGLAVLSDGSFSFGGTTDAFGDSNALAMHVTYDGQLEFAPGSGMKMTSLSGSSEAPYPAPAITTSSVAADHPVVRVAKPITPAALAATAKKLSK